MSKVMTFSRCFPATHPRKGMPTFFVEKILKSMEESEGKNETVDYLVRLGLIDWWHHKDFAPKKHTIRKGHRFKIGDKFSPRIWTGKPYKSNQFIIYHDLEVRETYDFMTDGKGNYFINRVLISREELEILAHNDGLMISDFEAWFSEPFSGQVICWVECPEYHHFVPHPAPVPPLEAVRL